MDKICTAQVQGFEVELPGEKAATSRVMVLSGHFDLPARSAVLEQVSYSGHDSCCYCKEKGKTVSTSARGHVVTFPFRDTPTGHAELRTSKDIEQDSSKALHENSSVNGFRSPSPLFGLPGFSIPLGVSIDYMHGVCLGVVKTLVSLWFDSSNTGKKWYCGELVHQVDSRLLSIKPPSAITRVPRSIDSHRKHWKAAEYRSWLFFYSLPCMKGILSDELFNHYALLVGGIYLLCQESISPYDLKKAEMLLAHFVEMVDVYYAPRYLLLNVHNLLHLVEDVNANGPLWCNSLFVFEDWNGDISDFFHGTQNVANQILSAVSCRQNMPELIAKMPDGQAKNLVLKLRNGSEKENRTPIGEGINIVGTLRSGGLRPEFEDDVVSGLEVDSLNEVKFFARVQIRGRIIHSRAYKRVSVRNSYTVSYKDSNKIKYGQVEVFVQARSPRNDSVQYAAVILPFLEQTGFMCPTHEVLGVCPVTHIACCYPPLNDQCVLVPINNIEDICVCMESRNTGSPVVYIARFPNHIEKD